VNLTPPPDTRRDAMHARRTEILSAHPEITAAAELAPLMGDLAQEYWDWRLEGFLNQEGDQPNINPERSTP
jgi:hypothetical protein